jgi:hypothetical protein
MYFPSNILNEFPIEKFLLFLSVFEMLVENVPAVDQSTLKKK